MAFLAFIPLYRVVLHPGKDLFSAIAFPQTREYVISFIVHAMMIDLPKEKER